MIRLSCVAQVLSAAGHLRQSELSTLARRGSRTPRRRGLPAPETNLAALPWLRRNGGGCGGRWWGLKEPVFTRLTSRSKLRAGNEARSVVRASALAQAPPSARVARVRTHQQRRVPHVLRRVPRCCRLLGRAHFRRFGHFAARGTLFHDRRDRDPRPRVGARGARARRPDGRRAFPRGRGAPARAPWRQLPDS